MSSSMQETRLVCFCMELSMNHMPAYVPNNCFFVRNSSILGREILYRKREEVSVGLEIGLMGRFPKSFNIIHWHG